MGRFFSNIQIQNKQENREQFLTALNNAMGKRGLLPATEDDASLTYTLAFSENSDWVTLCFSDYQSDEQDVKNDVSFFAESLKTRCISTIVVDSDFAILEMYNATSTMTDTVIVGDGSGYGFDDDPNFGGKEEHWQPLLKDGATWEQLIGIWNGDYVFTEEALSEMALLIGMDSQNIISDYEYLDSNTENNSNIAILHFKKKDKKALSLDSAFKKVFGKTLAENGFVKIKGRHPYFVRVVEGGEIIHIITYRKEHALYRGNLAFNILGGIATVYRYQIDLKQGPSDNINWLKSLRWVYRILKDPNPNDEFANSIYNFTYIKDDEKSMLEALEYSHKVTKEYMLSTFDKVDTLEKCIEYFEKFNLRCSPASFDLIFGHDGAERHDEGSLYIKTNNNKFKEKWEKVLNKTVVVDESSYKWVEERVKFFDDPYVHGKALEELERRKIANTEILRSYGLDL